MSLVSGVIDAEFQDDKPDQTKPTAKPRRQDDAYETPLPLANAICARLAAILPKVELVVEPSAGGGNFVQAARHIWPEAFIWANDIQVRPELHSSAVDIVRQSDWAEFARDPALVSTPKSLLILGNPPFSLVEQHIVAGLGVLKPGDHLAFLLRLSILGGRKRSETLWARPGFRYLIPIAGRPSFTDDGKTDSAEYCVCVWQGDHVGRAEVLQPLTWKVKTERRRE